MMVTFAIVNDELQFDYKIFRNMNTAINSPVPFLRAMESNTIGLNIRDKQKPANEYEFGLLTDKLLKSEHGLMIFQVGKNNLRKFTEFVFNVYSEDYKKKYGWESTQKELEQMILEDKEHFESSIFIAMKSLSGKMIGAVKLTKKTSDAVVFPIEKEFGIDVKGLYPAEGVKPNEIWQGGRLAIDHTVVKSAGIKMNAIKMFKTIYYYVAKICSKYEDNILVSEADELAYKLQRALGTGMKIVGEGKDYLGSKTYPTMMSGKDLQNWLKTKYQR